MQIVKEFIKNIPTQEQLNYYLAFIEKYPVIQKNETSSTNPRQMKDLRQKFLANLKGMRE